MNLKTTAKVILLVSMGLFLASRLLNGSLSYYIHPRFNVLTFVTAVSLVVMGLGYGLYARRQPADDHDHDHHHSHELPWAGLLLLALPVLLGVLVTPTPLGANALSNREVNVGPLTSASVPEGSQLTVIPNAGERNIMDWLNSFQRSSDPAAFNGEEAHVVGFVYRDDRFGSDQFMVGRFTVSCCVADAAPIGLIVQSSQAGEFSADQWVEVKGTFQAQSFNGVTMPILVAESITPTEPPAQPYLYQ